MKIIDNKKDYYDYVSAFWGEDPKAIYDRRGSVPLGGENQAMEGVFAPPHRYEYAMTLKEHKKYEVHYYPNILKARTATYRDTFYEGDVTNFCLEVGRWHYYFSVHNYIENNEQKQEHVLIKKTKDEPKHTKYPLAIYLCDIQRTFTSKDIEVKPTKHLDPIENPILAQTWIRKEIEAEEIWNNIYTYISSLNDEKDITDNRTNEQKIESYGFDKKTSFRNIK